MSDEPEFVAATLAWCNERRVEKGQEPLDVMPKGQRGDPLSCPCGKATGLEVQFKQYRTVLDIGDGRVFKGDYHPLPYSVTEFVRAFDNELLPQYDEHPRTEEDLDD